MHTPSTVHEGDFVLVMPGIEFVEDNIKEARIGPFFELEIKTEFVTDLRKEAAPRPMRRLRPGALARWP